MKTLFKKSLLVLMVAFIAVFTLGVTSKVKAAESNTYSYTFTARQFTANGTKTLNGVEWTVAGDSSYFWLDSNGKGQQFGKSAEPNKNLNISSTFFNDKIIKSVKINTSGASKVSASFVVKINNTQVGNKISLTKTATDYTFENTQELQGKLEFVYTQTSSKALYVKSIEVVYEIPATKDFKKDFSLSETKASLNLKWSYEEQTVTGLAWEQVFDSSELNLDDTYCFANLSAKQALGVTQNSNNRAAAEVDVVENKFGDNEQIQKIVLEEGSAEGTYAFNVGNGYLYAAGSSSNYLKTQEKIDSNASWTIEFDNSGNATIVAPNSSNRNIMRYNEENKLYSCYASNSSVVGTIQVFKLVEADYKQTVYSMSDVAIRFGATISQDLYEGLLTEGSNVSFGVAVAKAQDLTDTTLVEAFENEDDVVKTVTFTKEEVVAADYTFACVITNVPNSFFDSEFVAACYVEIDGEVYFMNTKQITVLGALQNYTQEAVSDSYTEDIKSILTHLYNTYNK